MHAYQDKGSVKQYLAFLNSSNGQIFRKVILDAVYNRLKNDETAAILDAGCGSGWLTAELSRTHNNIQGCDASAPLIDTARRNNPNIKFEVADLTASLPYPDENFDIVVLSMVAHDVDDQKKAFANLRRVLKPNGKIIATIVNPYYGFPAGVWKRGLWRFLFRRKPVLKLAQAYNRLSGADDKDFSWQHGLTSKFHSLSQHLNTLMAGGFELKYFEDLKSPSDSVDFNLSYQLFRFPIILLLEFAKKAG